MAPAVTTTAVHIHTFTSCSPQMVDNGVAVRACPAHLVMDLVMDLEDG
jgi:hypothetical protein